MSQKSLPIEVVVFTPPYLYYGVTDVRTKF